MRIWWRDAEDSAYKCTRAREETPAHETHKFPGKSPLFRQKVLLFLYKSPNARGRYLDVNAMVESDIHAETQTIYNLTHKHIHTDTQTIYTVTHKHIHTDTQKIYTLTHKHIHTDAQTFTH